jgi:hypothetical protein
MGPNQCLCDDLYTGSQCQMYNVLGTVKTNPGSTYVSIFLKNHFFSCYDIWFMNNDLPSGIYWIKPGVASAYQVYCDMQNGGWTLIESFQLAQTASYTQYMNDVPVSQDGVNFVG